MSIGQFMPFAERSKKISLELIDGATIIPTISGTAPHILQLSSPLGEPSPDRVIIVAVHHGSSNTANRTITAATIGGVAANILTTGDTEATGTHTSIIQAKVPNGVVGDIRITLSSGDVTFNSRLAIYRLTGRNSWSFPYANKTSAPGVSSRTLTVPVVSGDLILASGRMNGTASVSAPLVQTYLAAAGAGSFVGGVVTDNTVTGNVVLTANGTASGGASLAAITIRERET